MKIKQTTLLSSLLSLMLLGSISWSATSNESKPLSALDSRGNLATAELDLIPDYVDTLNKQTQALFVQLPPNGKLAIKLHPGLSTPSKTPTQFSFGLPLPKGFLHSAKKILIVSKDGKEIPSTVSVTNHWRSLDSKNPEQSIRSVLISLNYNFENKKAVDLIIVFGTERKTEIKNTLDPWLTWSSIKYNIDPNEYPEESDIQEPPVFVTLPPAWLSASLLRSRSHTLNSIDAAEFYDTSFMNFSKTAVNDVSKHVTEEYRSPYQTEAEPWLFDRAMTLFGAYIISGDVKWLRHAHRATEFYAKQLSPSGYLALKPKNDVKYSYGQSILLNYMLHGNPIHNVKVEAVARAGGLWSAQYKKTALNRFWTERHMAFVFLGALSAWELTGKSIYVARMNELLDIAKTMTYQPMQSDWKPVGCMLHRVTAHQGWGGEDPTCSPWMLALFAEVIWRHYLHFENKDVLKLLSSFGDYIAGYGLYLTDKPGTIAKKNLQPFYLSSAQHKRQFDYEDHTHACDVAGITARSVWAKGVLGADSKSVRDAAQALLETCKVSMNHMHRKGADRKYGKTVWRISPHRQYNWQFGSTTDLFWLLENGASK